MSSQTKQIPELEYLYEYIRDLAYIGGLDWDNLTPEKQVDVATKLIEVIKNYINTFMENLYDDSIKKHLQMIIASNFNPKLIKQYPEVAQWLNIAMNGLTQEYINQSNSTNHQDHK